MAINPDPNYRDTEVDELLQADPNDPASFERFNAPPPGHSLTDEPGKWPWEKPTQYSDPKEAMEFVVDKLEEPENEENFLRLMLGGAPIEAIVNTICFGGFTEGQWTPDIAELLKIPLTLHFIGLAMENKIPATVFNIDPEKQKENRLIPDEQVMISMKKERPDMYEAIMGATEELIEDEDQQEEPQEASMMNMEEKSEPEEMSEGFMNMEEERAA